MKLAADFPALLESFFTQRLIAQRKASPHTIASYRDTFRLLLQFAQKRLGTPPSQLTLEDLNAPFLGKFLDELEATRANGARSRNLRLTAIRSFFRYAALEVPQHAGLIRLACASRRSRVFASKMSHWESELTCIVGGKGAKNVVRLWQNRPSRS